MADRRVTQTRKDSDGDITALCNPGERWSPRQESDAINDIDSGTHTYYVQQPGTSRANVQVVNGPNGKYLRTTADRSDANNLDNLDPC